MVLALGEHVLQKLKVVRPFDSETFADLQRHVREVRRLWDWPGAQVHDKDHAPDNYFGRWYYHNLPLGKRLHRDHKLIALVSDFFNEGLFPSYCFLSCYSGEHGAVCPPHKDRKMCRATIDILVNSDHKEKPWPIFIDDQEVVLREGEAVIYSGTDSLHYRKPMKESSDATKVDLLFFHFVNAGWMGCLD